MNIIDTTVYENIKTNIRKQLNSVAESFVLIGYQLKKVRDEELYIRDGYKDIYEFAQSEYGLHKSNTSRFININDKFSINGNSTTLLEEYKGYGSSKLSEMLNLDEEELKMISEKTTVRDIRDLKQTKEGKTEVATPQQVDFTQSEADFTFLNTIIIDYFKKEEQKEKFSKLIRLSTTDNCLIQKIFNPSGHLTHKVDKEIAFFESDKIKYKKFGMPTLEFDYVTILDAMNIIYEATAKDPWEQYYGKSDSIPGQQKIDDYPEYLPEEEEEGEETDNEVEIFELNGEPYGNHWNSAIVSLVKEILKYNVEINDIDGEKCNVFGRVYFAYKVFGYIVLEDEDGQEVLKTSVERFKREYEWHKANIEKKTQEDVKTVDKNVTDTKNETHSNTDVIKECDIPLLKNNDQRKEWIEAYKNWTIWIDLLETGERYYKFDVTDTVAIVIKVSKRHEWSSKAIEFGVEEYYLLGIKEEWKQSGTSFVENTELTFYECKTNKSALIEYLKHIQRKG